jgi:hypothetical protein
MLLRVLVHHGLRVASARGPTVSLVRELVVLVWRGAIVRLVGLRVGTAHLRH